VKIHPAVNKAFRVLIRAALIMFAAFVVYMIAFANGYGRPVGQLMAYREIRAYFNSHYDISEYKLKPALYNFVQTEYVVQVESKRNPDVRFIITQDMDGTIHDGFEEQVESGRNTAARFGKEYADILRPVFREEFGSELDSLGVSAYALSPGVSPGDAFDPSNLASFALQLYFYTDAPDADKAADILKRADRLMRENGRSADFYNLRIYPRNEGDGQATIVINRMPLAFIENDDLSGLIKYALSDPETFFEENGFGVNTIGTGPGNMPEPSLNELLTTELAADLESIGVDTGALTKLEIVDPTVKDPSCYDISSTDKIHIYLDADRNVVGISNFAAEDNGLSAQESVPKLLDKVRKLLHLGDDYICSDGYTSFTFTRQYPSGLENIYESVNVQVSSRAPAVTVLRRFNVPPNRIEPVLTKTEAAEAAKNNGYAVNGGDAPLVCYRPPDSKTGEVRLAYEIPFGTALRVMIDAENGDVLGEVAMKSASKRQ